MGLPVQRNINIFLGVLPEGPSIIIGCSIKNFNISTRHTANWPVPTVSYSCVKVSCVETFKVCIKWDKTLKQKRTQIHWCDKREIWPIKRLLKWWQRIDRDNVSNHSNEHLYLCGTVGNPPSCDHFSRHGD